MRIEEDGEALMGRMWRASRGDVRIEVAYQNGRARLEVWTIRPGAPRDFEAVPCRRTLFDARRTARRLLTERLSGR